MKSATVRLLQSILFLLLLGMAVAAYGVNQEVQADLLMAKITSAIKAGRAADALLFFAELENMEPSLSEPLPEGFYYNYIVALDKAGEQAKALERANAYVETYGRRGKHYGQVVEIMSRLEIEADKMAARQAALEAKAAEQAAAQKEW